MLRKPECEAVHHVHARFLTHFDRCCQATETIQFTIDVLEQGTWVRGQTPTGRVCWSKSWPPSPTHRGKDQTLPRWSALACLALARPAMTVFPYAAFSRPDPAVSRLVSQSVGRSVSSQHPEYGTECPILIFERTYPCLLEDCLATGIGSS